MATRDLSRLVRLSVMVAIVSGFTRGMTAVPNRATNADFDGDGRADITVFRPSNGTWYTRYTATLTSAALTWGGEGDIPVPGDYDGDGITDIAVFRPSNGVWYARYSGSPTSLAFAWGSSNDVPVPGDYNGDGKTEIAIFRPVETQKLGMPGVWYVYYGPNIQPTVSDIAWGGGNDIPVPADYDGDGKTDIAVYRLADYAPNAPNAVGTWFIRYTATPTSDATAWGGGRDIPVAADYDGDGKADIGVYRLSDYTPNAANAVGTWHIRYTATPTSDATAWGGGSDIPVPADYDRDGITDIAVFRPPTGTWFIRYSATPTSAAIVWGGGNDSPILRRPAVPTLLNLTGSWSGTYTSSFGPNSLGVIVTETGPLSLISYQYANQLAVPSLVEINVPLGRPSQSGSLGPLILGGQAGTTVTYLGALQLSPWPWGGVPGCGSSANLSGSIVADATANTMTGTFARTPAFKCGGEFVSFTLQKQ